MSTAYNYYLEGHIAKVKKAYEWIQLNIPEFLDTVDKEQLTLNIMTHDNSKYSRDEYSAYDEYFYGTPSCDSEERRKVSDHFNVAWNHHIHNNPHHWEYWILIDKGKVVPLDMPDEYIIEMICDWASFTLDAHGSIKYDDLRSWYIDNRFEMILSPYTSALITNILNEIGRISEGREEV